MSKIYIAVASIEHPRMEKDKFITSFVHLVSFGE